MKTFEMMFCFILLLGFSSCSKKLTPYTENLHQKINWTEGELKEIQFYLSKDIVLRRELTKGISDVVDGNIRMIDGKRIEEIVFRKGTPGVLLFTRKENHFAISFENSDDPKYLMFGPSPKAGNKYVLLASDWNRSRGKVTYEDKKYFTPNESAYATLLVDLKRARKVSVSSRTARGRTVK